MPEMVSDSRPPDRTHGVENTSRDRPTAPDAMRTGAAGRAFIAALGNDFAALGRRVAQSLHAFTERKSTPSAPIRRGGASSRVILAFAKGGAVVAVLG